MLEIPQELEGCKLFPVLPGDKLPALSYGWQTRATNDRAQLADWDRGMADLNWGIPAGSNGLFVFDVDPSGIEKWKEIQESVPGLKEAIAASFTVRTPRGGYHHYFKGQGPTTASAIAPGIDTRGGYIDERTGKWKSLGYVVTPGSRTVAGAKTVNGAYEALGGTIEAMSPAVLQIVPEKKKGAALGLEKPIVPDNPRNISWARDLLNNYVKEGRVSVEGHGGDNTCFQVVASILDKGVSAATAYELLDEIWNPHCSPPWEDWELEQKIINAVQYGEETGEGGKGFLDNESAFSQFTGKDFGADELEKTSKRKHALQLIHDYARMVKDPSWLIKDFIPAQGTGILYGFSGSYKSFIALDMALCLAYGHPGQWGAPPVQNDVIYFAGESPRGMSKLRKPAWQEWQGKAGDENHRFFFYPYVPAFAEHEEWEDVKAQIEEQKVRPRLIIIDTLTRLLTGLDENSTKDANIITSFLEKLAAYYDCFVLVIHHTGKDESRGARGSSVYYANLDSALYLKKKKGGVALIVKNHKEADVKDGEIYFATQEFGSSIVLKQVEHLDDEQGNSKSKISWSDPTEISQRIQKLGGKISIAVLAQDISSEFRIEKAVVLREIRSRGDIQWMRDGEYWRVPVEEMEFDL